MLVTQIAQALQELLGRGDDAAFALHRLNHDGAGVVAHELANALQVVEVGVENTARYRAKALGVLGLAAYAHGEERAAMERLVERNDFVFMLAVVVDRPAACQLQRGFVGFTAGGA